MQAGSELGMRIDLRPEPIYSATEADAWLSEAKAARPDGLLVILLDRQAHAWPTAVKAADSGIPSVVFAPIGAAFTTNTAPIAAKEGVFICSTSDFGQARYGLKMLKAGARIREMRYLVIRGNARSDPEFQPFGTKLRNIPAKAFLDEYPRTEYTEEIQGMAAGVPCVRQKE